jgi:outer membrane protein
MTRTLLLGLAVALMPATAHAQTTVPETLTLEDALRIARANNPEYLQILNDEDVASSGVRRAWGSLLPTVNSSVNWRLGSNTTVTGEDDFGQPVRLDDPITFRSSGSSQGINANMTLFDGGQNLRQLSLARAEVRSADARSASRLTTLVVTVTHQFYEAVRSMRLVEVERQNLETAQERLAQTEAQFGIATVSQVDVLGARRSVLDAERTLRNQEADAYRQRLLLAFIMGVEPATTFELETAVPQVFDPSALEEQALVDRALQVHPLLREAEAAVATARANSSVARGTRWPSVSGGFGFSRGASSSDFRTFGEINPLNHGWNASLGLSLPLFTGFETSHRIEVAETNERDALLDQRRTTLLVEQEIRVALADLRANYEALQLADQIAELASQRLSMAEEQYRVGALDFLQMQQLIDDNLNAQRQSVDAQFTFIRARATLEEKLAAPIQP